MNKVKNWLLDLNFLRKFLGWKIFQPKFTADLRLKVVDKMEASRVLVLAPHPDDETFGCGGTLRKISGRTKIVFLTDGAKGADPVVREEEAKKAAQILGIRDLEFLRYPDGELRDDQKKIKKIKKAVDHFRPKKIFVPVFTDVHPDHQATAKILRKVLLKSKFNGEIWSYEIWTPLLANRIVKIDEAEKEKVMQAYQSQLEERDYQGAVKGLNRYRAMINKGGRSAEAFFVCKRELYLKLFKF